MSIRTVACNNRRREFEIVIGRKRYGFPYAKAEPAPSETDRVAAVVVDAELANEAVTFTLESGRIGTIHAEQVLEYNRDPVFVRDAILYSLTIEAQKRLGSTPLSKRELIRQLRTSASQFYRLLDQANSRKSIDQMVELLQVLGCDVSVRVEERTIHAASAAEPGKSERVGMHARLQDAAAINPSRATAWAREARAERLASGRAVRERE
jgi:hypothetical protein